MNIDADHRECTVTVSAYTVLPRNAEQLLYIAISSILSRTPEQCFSFEAFVAELESVDFTNEQQQYVKQRLHLLEMCMAGGNSENGLSVHFGRGKLVIIE